MNNAEGAAAYDDADFIHAFENLILPEPAFRHADHVRLGFLYLRRWGFAEALGRFTLALKRFAAFHGAPGKYHETITVAFLALINQHVDEDDCGGDWAAFRRSHPELMDKTLLERFYPAELLASPRARRVFVLNPLAGEA